MLVKKKKKSISCSELLLSLIYYRTGAKERKTGHRQRTHLATSYWFPLPASSNYSKKKKKMFFTNGAHGVSIVKKCLLKNFFHKRPYFGKEAIFSMWVLLATFYFLSPKNSCYGIFFWGGVSCLNLRWFLCICMCIHALVCVCMYLSMYTWILTISRVFIIYYHFAVDINYFDCFGNAYIILHLKGSKYFVFSDKDSVYI